MNGARVAILLAMWFVLACGVVASGALLHLPVPPPLFLAVLASVALLTTFRVPVLRHWVLAADMRLLLAPHLVRFVGIAFLLLVERGVLAEPFRAVGWGDAIAASGAVVLLLAHRRLGSRNGRRALIAWNVFGLADMLLLLVTGVRLAATDAGQFALFRQLPFGLLPTFFVPLIITTHVVILVRITRARARPFEAGAARATSRTQ